MHQEKCVAFLKWAMPRLGLSWAGFAHCHRQVCKRLHRRVTELGLSSFAAYRDYTLDHDTEWEMIDAFCRVTVSRFYRDREVFERIAADLLPQLAKAARARGGSVVRAWSAGCAGGEEPFSLMLAWRFTKTVRVPVVRFEIVATDIDDAQLARARGGCYPVSALRELPSAWVKAAFVASGPLRCLLPEYREGIEFLRQDVRADAPKGPFDLILCRNLAFTYFAKNQQHEILRRLVHELAPGGALIIGRQERLPVDGLALTIGDSRLRIFRKPANAETASTLSILQSA